MSERKIIYQIKDTFHDWLYIDGKSDKMIKSTMFDDDQEFFDWCKQHGADKQWTVC